VLFLLKLYLNYIGAWLQPPTPLLPRLKKEYNCTSTPPLEFHGLL
jgi:hypothetical protein